MPEEFAEAVIFLCSDRASHVTGHVMAINEGLSSADKAGLRIP
ncbi:MAG: SDR family oxidoreductase [Terrimicrobiaceae bacterium]